MFDIKLIRDDLKRVREGLKAKNTKVDLEGLLDLDKQRRGLLVQIDELRAQKNAANDEISRLLKEKKDPKAKITAMKTISGKIDKLEPDIRNLQAKINEILIGIPNLPHESVPVRSDVTEPNGGTVAAGIQRHQRCVVAFERDLSQLSPVDGR